MIFKDSINNYTQLQGVDTLQLRAVLFDMDGVLFDSMPLHAKAWSQVMINEGFVFSPEEVYRNEGRTGNDTINTVSLAQRGRKATPTEIEKLCKTKCDLFDTYPSPKRIEGAIEFVKEIKENGLIPMIVTGSGTPTLLSRIEESFPGLFDQSHIVSSFHVKQGKPHPEPYLLALEKGGLKPSQAIVIENAPLGVQSAIAAGIFTIAINTGILKDSELIESGANLLFPSMRNLKDNWEQLRYELLNNN